MLRLIQKRGVASSQFWLRSTGIGIKNLAIFHCCHLPWLQCLLKNSGLLNCFSELYQNRVRCLMVKTMRQGGIDSLIVCSSIRACGVRLGFYGNGNRRRGLCGMSCHVCGNRDQCSWISFHSSLILVRTAVTRDFMLKFKSLIVPR